MTQTSLLIPELTTSSPFPEGLTGQQLADRLGVNPGTVSLETDNQYITAINQVKQPERAVNPLITGFEVNQATECPFIVGKSYTQQELKVIFKTDYGSDIINWIEKKKGSKNPIAQKYSRFFTTKGVGKDKIYVFNGE